MKARRVRSVTGPAIAFAIALVLVTALLVLWNVVLAVDYARIRELAERATAEGGGAFHWTFIALGSGLFVAAIVLFSVLGAQLFGEIRWTQRLSTFIAMFTHELNSPLASIKLFVQTLRGAPDLPREERERFLDLVLADVERLRSQISNVLRAAQIDAPHGFTIARQAVDLREYLEDYVAGRRSALERLAPGGRIELLDGITAEVAIDPFAFRQVLDNLVDNAVKFAGSGGARISIAIAPGSRQNRVVIEVRDEGSGIEARELDRIFERFARGKPSGDAGRQPGTGLGLFIVRSIVRAHGGSVAALSEGPGRGATMRIELPVRKAAFRPGELAPDAPGKGEAAEAAP